MTNYSRGHEAEKLAAKYLQKLGYQIRDLNWRTSRCEIDIIAQKGKVIFFVEVKYRNNLNNGSGIEYITPKKLQQMRYAAEIWMHENRWVGACQLAAIEVFGKDFKVTSFVENIV